MKVFCINPRLGSGSGSSASSCHHAPPAPLSVVAAELLHKLENPHLPS
jgi:hypothetical protein